MAKAKTIHAIQAATATTVGQWIPIANACKVSIIGQRSNHSSGSTAFSVEVCPQNPQTLAPVATAAVAYAKLIDNVTNTNAQTLLRVSSKSLAANGVCLLSMSPEDTAGFMRVTATETTDGTHDAWVMVQYE